MKAEIGRRTTPSGVMPEIDGNLVGGGCQLVHIEFEVG